MWSGVITKMTNFERKKISKVEEEQGKRGNVEGLPTQNDKPWGSKGEVGDGASGAVALPLSANLPHSSIYKH